MLRDGTGRMYIHCLVGGPHDGQQVPAGAPYLSLVYNGVTYCAAETTDEGRKAVVGNIDVRTSTWERLVVVPGADVNDDSDEGPPVIGVRMVVDDGHSPQPETAHDAS